MLENKRRCNDERRVLFNTFFAISFFLSTTVVIDTIAYIIYNFLWGNTWDTRNSI